MRQHLSIYFRIGIKVAYRQAASAFRNVIKRKNKVLPSNGIVRPHVELFEISSVLLDLGIKEGDLLLIHSGISNIGRLKGGAKALMSLIKNAVGESGTVMFPTFPFMSAMYDYLESRPVFNVKETHSLMGTLTEIALRDETGERSIHPTHPVLAIGPLAGALVSEHHIGKTPFGTHSPFNKLCIRNGKILLLGVGLNSVTNFHVIEDILGENFPVMTYLDRKYHIKCINENEEEIIVETACHNPQISMIRNCEVMREAFLREGVMKTVSLGRSSASALDAHKMNDFLSYLACEKRKTIYGRIWG